MKNEEVTLILAGGNLSLPFLENVIKEYAGATIIAADRGLEACMKLRERDRRRYTGSIP